MSPADSIAARVRAAPRPAPRWRAGEMTGYSRKKIDAEIAKCVLVCDSCHKERHRVMREADAA
jgi:hypothetical protein